MAKPIEETTGSLAGHLLIATATVDDGIFDRSVIYLCAHNAEGAMGMIVNLPAPDMQMNDILEQLSIEPNLGTRAIPIHFGGPVEAYRGFVVHTDDYSAEGSIIVKNGIAVTSNVQVLQDLSVGSGPSQGMLVLGYAGWAAGQLEAEIESGNWMVVPANRQIVFAANNAGKWNAAMASLGIDIGHLSNTVGHA